ncbi:hypothetical protein Cni_G24196 [Canna indica]|uniref:Cytochrome b6-f complex subunit 7 n=1 Tax=Canna indica TaxID=4628 RepID=A0AAQ3KVJ1_9LILI|nr:hypothetical protein Cni_G24196 [Canna indica]
MATLPATAASCTMQLISSSSMSGRKPSVSYVHGLSSFEGLKAGNEVSSLGVTSCTARCFARVVSSLRARKGRKSGGGSLASTCNAAGEIFKIAAIMNGLVLVGVAVGFVLLRIEAAVEEAD